MQLQNMYTFIYKYTCVCVQFGKYQDLHVICYKATIHGSATITTCLPVTSLTWSTSLLLDFITNLYHFILPYYTYRSSDIVR